MNQSYFDGSLITLLFIRITNWFLIGLTLGIATPWALTRIYRWQTEHTVIDGQRFYFTGTGGSLFANWIKWLLLTLITLGIYGFWVQIKLLDWRAKNTRQA